jgi:hypothetical protein
METISKNCLGERHTEQNLKRRSEIDCEFCGTMYLMKRTGTSNRVNNCTNADVRGFALSLSKENNAEGVEKGGGTATNVIMPVKNQIARY